MIGPAEPLAPGPEPASRRRPAEPDVLAPDGSEIRLIGSNGSVSMVECRLPAGQVTRAVRHRTVEEIWYVIAGSGLLWRSVPAAGKPAEENAGGDRTAPPPTVAVIELAPGSCETLHVGTSFQFRASDGADLVFVIATSPPWPGAHEAVIVEGPWEPSRP